MRCLAEISCVSFLCGCLCTALPTVPHSPEQNTKRTCRTKRLRFRYVSRNYKFTRHYFFCSLFESQRLEDKLVTARGSWLVVLLLSPHNFSPSHYSRQSEILDVEEETETNLCLPFVRGQSVCVIKASRATEISLIKQHATQSRAVLFDPGMVNVLLYVGNGTRWAKAPRQACRAQNVSRATC